MDMQQMVSGAQGQGGADQGMNSKMVELLAQMRVLVEQMMALYEPTAQSGFESVDKY